MKEKEMFAVDSDFGAFIELVIEFFADENMNDDTKYFVLDHLSKSFLGILCVCQEVSEDEDEAYTS